MAKSTHEAAVLTVSTDDVVSSHREPGTRLTRLSKHCDTRYRAAQGLRRVTPTTDTWTEQMRRGGLELAILLTVAPGPRYGLEIIRHLQEFTDLVVTEGTIYPILGRLARDGFLDAYWNNAESAHPRKYYRLTPSGRRQLLARVAEWRTFARKIDRLVRAAGPEVRDEAQ